MFRMRRSDVCTMYANSSEVDMSVTLYDIMAEDMMIWAKKVPNGQVNVYVENEDNQEVYNETSHRAAWDSLVYFARQVIEENKRLENADIDTI
jgi:hypothetical protein